MDKGSFFVFDLDAKSSGPISPVSITAKIRVSGTDLIEHAFVNVPKNMLHWATTEDALLERIRSRIQKAIPDIQVRWNGKAEPASVLARWQDIAAVCLVVTVILQAEVALLFIGAGIGGILCYGKIFKRPPPVGRRSGRR